MRIIKSVASLLLVAVLLIFVMQNSAALVAPVTLQMDLWVRDFSPGPIPVYGVLLFSFAGGLLLGGFWALGQRIRVRRQLREMQRLVTEKEKELTSLRNLPMLEDKLQGNVETQPS
jgi:uncharacterized integral membrane protein